MSAVKGKVISCKGLRNADWLGGKSDPYVRVTLKKGDEVLGEMKTANKTDELDPQWEDENFSFAHPGAIECTLEFKVMDTGFGPDEELGEAVLPVKVIPFVDEHVVFQLSLGIAKKKALGVITVALGVVPEAGLLGETRALRRRGADGLQRRHGTAESKERLARDTTRSVTGTRCVRK
eukprot:CAMPEP_0179036388 /NCGR_PEP_ID=MMETSP0796-20121207/13592_1 /TAXON_ID=73915 /ORGANISM="Pyrodinium bahamense, Strain pbaha01" /LENGTH=177 /DNA_ID=CAMNT_0020732673 /DNA_START=86 /DNA_END=620 /DNA_ORIENTATION=+